MKLLFLLLIATSGFSLEVYSQTLEYEIFKGKKSVGKLQIRRSNLAEKVRYQLESNVLISFLADFKVETQSDIVYQEGLLHASEAYIYLNDKIRETNKIRKKGNGYAVNKDDDEERILANTSIKYSVINLYYTEPVGMDKIFSERFAEYCALKKVESNVYKLTLPNGNHTIYHYRNGQCYKVEVIRPLANLEFRLI
ncbi:DUF6134 family protein [Rapidithrix thailandica]|uniref:DUF6134 family protein n=1 Tax=Rapidithrix thailandica TaxID=413964 RepID=A0AAW9SA40_9BACT